MQVLAVLVTIGEALQRLGGPLLLGVAPVPLLDPEPGLAVRDDAQQAFRVAVAVEQAVVGPAVARGVRAAEGPVAVGQSMVDLRPAAARAVGRGQPLEASALSRVLLDQRGKLASFGTPVPSAAKMLPALSISSW